MHPGPRTELLVVAVGNVVVLVVGFGIVCGVVPCAVWGIIFAAAYCAFVAPLPELCLLQQLSEVPIFPPFLIHYFPVVILLLLLKMFSPRPYVRDGLGSV